MQPAPTDALKRAARLWWILLVVGIIFCGFGIVTLFDVAKGATAVALVIGFFLIFDGLVEVISGGRGGGSRAVAVLLGAVLVIGGIVVIASPEYTIATIAFIWGITLLVGGVARVVAAIWLRDYGWGWRLVFGVLEAGVGVLVMVWPGKTAYVLLVLVGIYAIFAGLLQILLAFQLREAPERLADMGGGPMPPAV